MSKMTRTPPYHHFTVQRKRNWCDSLTAQLLLLAKAVILLWSLLCTVTVLNFHDYQNHTKIRRTPNPTIVVSQKKWKSSLFPAKNPKKPLRFVHIPKTGGTSVESGAAIKGYRWGVCMIESMTDESGLCSSLRKNFMTTNNEEKASNDFKRASLETPSINYPPRLSMPSMVSFWHLPLQYLPTNEEFAATNNKNPYEGFDLFAIVRNPYERIVSEYYYECYITKWLSGEKAGCFGKGPNAYDLDTPERMNRAIQDVLVQWKNFTLNRNIKDYFRDDGHWIPQFDYIYNVSVWGNNNDAISDIEGRGIEYDAQPFYQKNAHQAMLRFNADSRGPFSRRPPRIVQHILHYENLQEEFDSLMRSYSLNITLPPQKKMSRQNEGARCSAHDLTRETMKLIETVYKLDFELGPYPMLSSLTTFE